MQACPPSSAARRASSARMRPSYCFASCRISFEKVAEKTFELSRFLFTRGWRPERSDAAPTVTYQDTELPTTTGALKPHRRPFEQVAAALGVALLPLAAPLLPVEASAAELRLVAVAFALAAAVAVVVTPLLVGGSIVLALLSHVGADDIINTVFTPITSWWLGLPVVLGVPILFGVLRKELSLLMIYQALGSFDIGMYLNWVQMMTFLIFLTFYIPCISTFAVMLKTIGRKEAFFSIALSVGVALMVSGVIRNVMVGLAAKSKSSPR